MPHKPYLNALIAALNHQKLLDERLEAAFRAVPRHLFMPADLSLEQAYADEAVAVKRAPDGTWLSSASQPSMIAMMLRQLDVRPGHNVLEIGAGTGYNAALIYHLVGARGRVTTVELDKDLADTADTNLHNAGASTVLVVTADGALGYAPRASYDRITATVAIWDVPAAWARQLKPDGVLVAPLWLDGAVQMSARFTLQDDGTLYSDNNIGCGFVTLRGLAAGPALARRVGSTTLTVACDSIEAIDTAALHLLLSADHEISYLSEPMEGVDYWGGLMPYILMYPPPGFEFVAYTVGENLQAYGMEGRGFGLVSQTSACFVPFGGKGMTHCYAGSDAFLAMQDALDAWVARGEPRTDKLRLRLIPREQGTPDAAPPTGGKLYPRRDHFLHVWLKDLPDYEYPRRR